MITKEKISFFFLFCKEKITIFSLQNKNLTGCRAASVEWCNLQVPWMCNEQYMNFE